MGRCPLCRARLGEKATCPRCGADLSLAQSAETEASRCLNQAVAALAAHDRRSAKIYAKESLRLHRAPLSEVIAQWLSQTTERP